MRYSGLLLKLSAIASSCTTAELHSEAKQPARALVICLLRLVPIMLYTRVSSSLGASCSKQELSNYSQQSIGKCATVGTLLHKQYFLCLEGVQPRLLALHIHTGPSTWSPDSPLC